MSRRAFTLLDIILVLVLVGILAALAVPAMNAAFATYEVKQAANRLRARIREARSRAVEHGVPYAFLYVPGSPQHGFAACKSLLDALSATVGQSTLSELYRANPYDIHMFQFEDGFRLVHGTPSGNGLAQQAAGTGSTPTSSDPLLQLLTPEEDLIAQSGSPLVAEALRQSGLPTSGTAAVLLFPDGTTTGDVITVVGPNNLAVVVTIDELTGEVVLSDAMTVAPAQGTGPSVQRRLPRWDRRVQ